MIPALDRTATRIVTIGGIIVALSLLGFGASYCHQRNVTERARIDGRVSEGETRAADAATGAVADYADRQADRVEIDRRNRDEILSAPNADDSAGDAGDVGLRVLCDRPAYRSDPICLRLKGSAAVSR